MRVMSRRIKGAIVGFIVALLVAMVVGGWNVHARTVRSGIPGAVIPSWQLTLMAYGSKLRLPDRLDWACDLAGRLESPFWTPGRTEIRESAKALGDYLRNQSLALEPEIARMAVNDSYWLDAMLTWEHLHGHPAYSDEWWEAKHACVAAIVMSQLSSYRAQYLGVTHEGRPVVYVNAYCRHSNGEWYERLIPHRVIDGGLCYAHAYYDPGTQAIVKFWINSSAG